MLRVIIFSGRLYVYANDKSRKKIDISRFHRYWLKKVIEKEVVLID